jgi:hypothetical protein
MAIHLALNYCKLALNESVIKAFTTALTSFIWIQQGHPHCTVRNSSKRFEMVFLGRYHP